MQVVFIEKPTCENIAQAVTPAEHDDSVPLIVLGEKCGITPESLREKLLGNKGKFMGVVCPGVIYGARVYTSSALVVSLPAAEDPVAVVNLDQRCSDLPVALLRWADQAEALANQTVMVLVDGLAQGISSLLANISEILGFHLACVGGGVGYTDLVQRPSLFVREGVFSNAALLVPLRCKACWGVRHGWRRKGDPLIVTRSVSHTIVELNWKTAFDVYRDALREMYGKDLSPEVFSSVSRQHPLGILREGGEELVRDPVRVEGDGSLVCVGAVPENATVSLMEGAPHLLIEAARQATDAAFAGVPSGKAFLWVVDCVSRWLFLGERFTEELGMVESTAQKRGFQGSMAGFLSLGEIAGSRRGWVDFYNKTIVVTALHE